MQIYSGLKLLHTGSVASDGMFYWEPAGPGGEPWIKYAHADGSLLRRAERDWQKRKVIENRVWQCEQNQNQTNCNSGNFDNFPRTKKFVKFAEGYTGAQRDLKKCLFGDDVKRGALSGSASLFR